MKFQDLTGKKFNNLTVIKRVYPKKDKQTYWLCKCDCGNTTIVISSHLKDGHTKSCGCLQKETVRKLLTKHGKGNTKLYRVWRGIKERTTCDYNSSFKNYGGRGISMCDEWLNDFEEFYNWSIANGYKEGLTIDRIDVNGNYEPSNCRWITWKQQQNNRTNNHLITYKGETHTMKQWSEKLGIKYSTLSMRINQRHWSIEKAFTYGTF